MENVEFSRCPPEGGSASPCAKRPANALIITLLVVGVVTKVRVTKTSLTKVMHVDLNVLAL